MKISRENETSQINKQAKQNKTATTEQIKPDKVFSVLSEKVE